MYTYTCICMYIYIYIRRIYSYVCIYIYIYVYTHISYMYICMNASEEQAGRAGGQPAMEALGATLADASGRCAALICICICICICKYTYMPYTQNYIYIVYAYLCVYVHVFALRVCSRRTASKLSCRIASAPCRDVLRSVALWCSAVGVMWCRPRSSNLAKSSLVSSPLPSPLLSPERVSYPLLESNPLKSRTLVRKSAVRKTIMHV